MGTKMEEVIDAMTAIKPDSPHAVLEETDTAYDPTTQYVDLSKEEKRRTTALLMAIQAYNNIIIKDAEYYIAVKRDERNDNGPMIQPATMHAMVEAAMQFDAFIAGKYELLGEATIVHQAIRDAEAKAGKKVKPDKQATAGNVDGLPK